MLSKKLFACFATILLLTCGYALNEMPILLEMGGPHGKSHFGSMLSSLDFNHDGYDDLVILTSNYGYMHQVSPPRGRVYILLGGQGFGSSPYSWISLQGDYPNGTQRKITGITNVGDINGDGYDDLMITDIMPDEPGNTRFRYYFGGTPDLTTPDRIDYQLPNEDSYRFHKLGDIDNDGYHDVGIAYKYDNDLHFDIMWGGSYIRQNILAGTGYPPILGSIVGIGDINNDEYDDFSIGYVVGGNIGQYTARQSIYRGNEFREFSSYQNLIQVPSFGIWNCVSLGDVNGDGFDDFFAHAISEGLICWMGSDIIDPDNHDIALSMNVSYYQNISCIASGDFNGDGYSDVVGTNYLQNRLSVWLGSSFMDGNADFQHQSILYCRFGFSTAVGDFNGDGFDDIAVSAPSSQDLEEDLFYPGFVLAFAGNSSMVASTDPLSPPLSEVVGLQISPNPVRRNGKIMISLNGIDKYVGMPGSIEVYNIRGQAVYQTEILCAKSHGTIAELPLSGFSNGVYICRARIGNQSVSKKITIIK